MVKASASADDAPLKRLGGGRWQTRDGRFTIEPQSGTWVVIDAEQTDELGLPLVRGPFPSLTAAKAAIALARTSLPAESPLEARSMAIRRREDTSPTDHRHPTRRAEGGREGRQPVPPDEPPPPPPEPAWLAALGPADRRRARRLIDRLTAAGADDAEGLARRDIVGDVPAVAAFALARAIGDLGPTTSPAMLARLLTDGADEDLGVRWRLVDGDGRVITLDPGTERGRD